MDFKLILPICLTIFSFLHADKEADVILNKILQHLEGQNRTMMIESKIVKKGKIKKKQEVKINLYYPKIENMKKMTFIEFFKPKQKVGVKYWEHLQSDNIIQKWITMPITGKLKNISNKKTRKNDFDFSDLELTKETILNHHNSIIDNSDNLIIESISKINNQKKRLFIDPKFNFIYKVEIFNKKNRLIKSIECLEFNIVENFKIASKVIMKDYKKKHTVEINIFGFQFQNFTKKNIFQPKGK